MRYLVYCKYDGTLFHGFQRQNDFKSVQKTIEEALSNYLKEDIVIKGAGRTDAGVHALGQTFHFDASKKLPTTFLKDVNKLLNNEVVLTKIKKVNTTFHARHNAKEKVYCYKINLGKYTPDYEGYILQPKEKINVKNIKKIAPLFIGTHDFHNFVAGFREDYVTTIYKIKVRKHHNILEIIFYGQAFYRYMIRKLVGAMLAFNKGKVTKEEIQKMLEDKTYTKELATVPAEGLYLIKVRY